MTMRTVLAVLLLASNLALADETDVRAPEKRALAEVTKLLEDQAGAWNRGELAAFCSVYADDALFVSPSGLTRGRAEVLARYEKKYPDAASRGTLTLEVIEARFATGPKDSTQRKTATPPPVRGVTVVAKWTLAKEKESATGHTLLVLLPRDRGGWEIVQDASF